MPPFARAPQSERSLAAPVRAYLEAAGYRVWVDPDGTDYFDLVAKRGQEVGLVELKLADWRKVFGQALRRRAWGDWVAVVVPRPSLATKLSALSGPVRSQRVGIWHASDGPLTVLRPALPLVQGAEEDPFATLRGEFRRLLDLLERGELPAGVRWSYLARLARSTQAGRSLRDWRLDEL